MIITKTPLRISFLGGGTDIPDIYRLLGQGIVVSTSINKYVYVLVNRRRDSVIKLSYSKIEIVDRVDKLEHNLIRECLKFFNIESGIEIVYSADLPINTTGSGLGSSSALIVGLVLALSRLVSDDSYQDPLKLAEIAYKIEREMLGFPVGKQDSYAAAFGGLNKFIFRDDETVEVYPLPRQHYLPKAISEHLHLFYTGIDRKSSEILDRQRISASSQIEHYRTLASLASQLDQDLRVGIFNSIGTLMHQGWKIKRSLEDRISSPQIDLWYERAIRSGADGGKLCGAGGGGFLLFYSKPESMVHVITSLKELSGESIKLTKLGATFIEIFEQE